MKIVTVVGARPQFIKAAAVSRAMSSQRRLQEVLVHTGQHYDPNMSEIFFEELGIPKPAFNLEIGSGMHGAQTARMLIALEKVFGELKPAMVLVYGDTNSTLASALAASKLQIPIAHVEAGLRSWNRAMPEELNRILTDHASSLLFTPTRGATEILRREGIADSMIREVGDVMYDAALHYGKASDAKAPAHERYQLRSGEYILATLHRPENTDHPNRLSTLIETLVAVAKKRPVLLPLHPRTRKLLAGKLEQAPGLQVVEPVGYLEMVSLEKHAAVIATDSGGIQKEAFFHQVPCVTLRDETEWTELVELGWNRLAPPLDAARVTKAILDAVGTWGRPGSPYGGGDASLKIVAELERWVGA